MESFSKENEKRSIYKLDKVVFKDKSDWIEIEDNHEAIIDSHDFEIVQKLLKCDIKAKFEILKAFIYQELKEGIIAEEEFYDMREFYTNRIVESELILEKQSKEIARLYKKSLGNQNFLADIKKYQNIGTLERGLLV